MAWRSFVVLPSLCAATPLLRSASWLNQCLSRRAAVVSAPLPYLYRRFPHRPLRFSLRGTCRRPVTVGSASVCPGMCRGMTPRQCCIRACVPACLRACVLAGLRACVLAYLRTCVPKCVCAVCVCAVCCVLLACMLACMLACCSCAAQQSQSRLPFVKRSSHLLLPPAPHPSFRAPHLSPRILR